MTDEPIRPDRVVAGARVAEEEGERPVTEPTKLIRIAAMTRAMLDEVRQTPPDEAGRERLMRVHERSLDELRGVLSQELLDEFNEMFESINQNPAPSESVIRIAQAQLIGWLEGLFHGIHASLWSQQMATQAQLAEVQRRQLGSGGRPEQPTGPYL